MKTYFKDKDVALYGQFFIGKKSLEMTITNTNPILGLITFLARQRLLSFRENVAPYDVMLHQNRRNVSAVIVIGPKENVYCTSLEKFIDKKHSHIVM